MGKKFAPVNPSIKKTLVHFNASTFMATYLHQFSAVVLFGTNLRYIWYKFSIISKHNIPKYKKKHILCLISTFLV